MKLNRYLNAFILSISVILFLSCDDEKLVHSGSNTLLVDPTILQTDEFGNIIGGDTTDWCYRGGSGVRFNPVYPSPTNDTFFIHFSIARPDTLTLYFLNSSTDTIFFWNNQPVHPGFYDLSISSEALGYNSIVKRLFLRVRTNSNTDPFCRYYGDIQFF